MSYFPIEAFLNRTNHTGTQTAATISNFAAAALAAAPAETLSSIGALVNSSSEETTLVNGDYFGFRHNVSGLLKKISWSNFKAILDTLYNLYTHPNHTGDVTSLADGATTISANVVTNNKAAQMAANTVKVNNTNATANATDLNMPASTFLARLTSGNIVAATIAEARALLGSGYTEAAGAAVTSPSAGWQTVVLTGAPANMKVDVMIQITTAVAGSTVGVRAVGSALNRTLTVGDALLTPTFSVVISVLTNGSSQIQVFTSILGGTTFRYWGS